MLQVNLEDMKKDLSKFVQGIQYGEKLIIKNFGKPVAEVKPIITSLRKMRPYALCAGEFKVPDDFDDPLPEDILVTFQD